jgi:hypothetical protein
MTSQVQMTVDFNRAASGPSASAKVAFTSRPIGHAGTPPAPAPTAHCAADTLAQQARDARWSVPQSLGRSNTTAPAAVLI